MMQIICQFGNESIVHNYLCTMLYAMAQERSMSTEFAQQISSLFIWLQYNKPQIFQNGLIDTNLLHCCSSNIQAMKCFLQFFLMRLNEMSAEIIEFFLSVASTTFFDHNEESIIDAIFILSRLIRSSLPKEFPFFETYFQNLKKYY